MNKEIWKYSMSWIPDNKPNSTKAIVEISSFGRVKRLSYTRWNKHNNGYSNIKQSFYSPQVNRDKQRLETPERIKKYGLYNNVYINGKSYSIHRLVAISFIDNPDNKPQVNHIDGIRSNNNVENLEWTTQSENQRHAILNNIKKTGSFITLTDSQKSIIIIMRLKYFTTVEIANEISLSHETVRKYLSKHLYNDKDIYNKIKSFSRLLTNKESGIRIARNKFSFKHAKQFYKTLETKQDAIKCKDKYICSNFESNTGVYIRWKKTFNE